MRKRIVMGSFALAALGVAASQAGAQSGAPVYRTIFYSDATHQTAVGSLEFDYCTYQSQVDGVQYQLEGTYTQYSGDDELLGYCSGGYFYPI